MELAKAVEVRTLPQEGNEGKGIGSIDEIEGRVDSASG